MKSLILLLALVFSSTLSLINGLASDVPQLARIEAKYDAAKRSKDEALRQKYVTELAVLRWKLTRENKYGWKETDAEIFRHPAAADSDGKALSKAMVGTWHSPRHDYVYRADGTWVMDPDPTEPDSTHGTWTIKGNQYVEVAGTTPETTIISTIILLDKENLIFADAKTGEVFYEKRSLKGGLPLRRDE